MNADALPMSATLATMPRALQLECTVAGGDDYELLFTAAPSREREVLAAADRAGVAVTRIGRIETALGLRIVDARGAPLAQGFSTFDHFRTP